MGGDEQNRVLLTDRLATQSYGQMGLADARRPTPEEERWRLLVAKRSQGLWPGLCWQVFFLGVGV